MKKVKFFLGSGRHISHADSQRYFIVSLWDMGVAICKYVKIVALIIFMIIMAVGMLFWEGCRWIYGKLMLPSPETVIGLWKIARFARSASELEGTLNKFPTIPIESQMSASVQWTSKTFFTRIFTWEGEYTFCGIEGMPGQCVIKKWRGGDHVATWLLPCELSQFVFIR